MRKDELESLLERVADGDEAAHQELIDLIMKQPEGIRVLAFEALQDGGDNTYDQLLLTLAEEPDYVVRPNRRNMPLPENADTGDMHLIAQQAGREWQEKVSPKAPRELMESLRTGSELERVRAARALAEYADPASIPHLVGLIRSGERKGAAAAVETLQAIGPAAVPALAEAASDRDEQVRWHAAKALSTIADERAVPVLISLLEDGNYGTRWLAAEGLAQVGRPTLVPLFRKLAEEKSSAWLKQGAWHSLNKIALANDEERKHYRRIGAELKQSSAANMPNIARTELRRLGQDA